MCRADDACWMHGTERLRQLLHLCMLLRRVRNTRKIRYTHGVEHL